MDFFRINGCRFSAKFNNTNNACCKQVKIPHSLLPSTSLLPVAQFELSLVTQTTDSGAPRVRLLGPKWNGKTSMTDERGLILLRSLMRNNGRKDEAIPRQKVQDEISDGRLSMKIKGLEGDNDL